MVPRYPDGNRARAHTVVRRLSPALELVSRGPNGSRARGATYRVILPPGPVGVPLVRADVPDTGITSDLEWLLQQVERMTGGGSK
jgi:hypothetical protein